MAEACSARPEGIAHPGAAGCAADTGPGCAVPAASAPPPANAAAHAPCPRARLISALALAFGMAAVSSLALVPVLLCVAAFVAVVSGQLRQVARGLRGAALLATAFLVILPLTSGQTVLASFGPVALRAEGLEAGLLVAGRLLAIVAVTLAFLASVAPFRLVAALRALGLPTLMADLALLTLRYLDEVRTDIARARTARGLRGGRSGWRGVPDHGLMIAAGLIRGHQRAERLWAAMRLRGQAAGLAAPMPPMRRRDLAMIALSVLCALALVGLEGLA